MPYIGKIILRNRIWKECVRVLKPAGRLCVNIQPLFSDYMPTHHIISKQLLDSGLLWKAEILWEKHNYNCKYTAWGSWKSPSMPYMKYTWEFIEVFCKESHRKEGPTDKIDISGDEFKKWVYGRWEIAPESNMKKYNHPAMFPEELVARLLKLFSYQGDVVLDPFNGAGTTTLVSAKRNRYFIGIDISREYCDTAFQRLQDFYSRALFSLPAPIPQLVECEALDTTLSFTLRDSLVSYRPQQKQRKRRRQNGTASKSG